MIFFYLQINTQYIFILSIKIMLIQKNSKGTDGLTAEDKRDLFDLINGSDGDKETG
mgnify:CR=1 FL=1